MGQKKKEVIDTIVVCGRNAKLINQYYNGRSFEDVYLDVDTDEIFIVTKERDS